MTENDQLISLQVLLVEDEPADLVQYERDLPALFRSQHVDVTLHPCSQFADAIQRATNPAFRYDLIISDTYQGETRLADAKVMEMVNQYRGFRFCPLVVYSSGVKPLELVEGPFVLWADKAKPGDIDNAIRTILATGIPQIARMLHDDIDKAGSVYLWKFLESKWTQLGGGTPVAPKVLERLMRRRAAVQIGRLDPVSKGSTELEHVEGLECYLYPPVSENLRLGEIIRDRTDGSLRMILTPHCHLTVQESDTNPRADFVLTVRVLPARDVIIQATAPKHPWSGNDDKQMDMLRRRIQLSAELGKPSGRYCFIPAFLDIPDAYCDLLQLESMPYKKVIDDFERIAVFDTPFAEALQASFTGFYSAVGLPNFNPEQFRHLIRHAESPAK